MISFEDFKKVELRVGEVKAAERVEGSDKLLKLAVDLGPSTNSGSTDSEQTAGLRQILAGVGKVYAPETLIGKKFIFAANLEPRMMMGLESQGMIIAGDGEAGPVMVVPDGDMKPGTLLH